MAIKYDRIKNDHSTLNMQCICSIVESYNNAFHS